MKVPLLPIENGRQAGPSRPRDPIFSHLIRVNRSGCWFPTWICMPENRAARWRGPGKTSRHQASKLQRNLNIQIPTSARTALHAWGLVILWSLELGRLELLSAGPLQSLPTPIFGSDCRTFLIACANIGACYRTVFGYTGITTFRLCRLFRKIF